ELTVSPDEVEIGYRDGERSVFVPDLAPQIPSDRSTDVSPAGTVVLATGGARGITAELLRTMAKPGMTLILVGRAALDANESVASAERPDRATLRAQLIERSRANGVQRRPAEIEQAVSAEMRRREAARTIASLRALGAAVEYHAVDVGNFERFTALIA